VQNVYGILLNNEG